MQESGSRRLDDARHAENDQPGIDSDDFPVITVNPAHETVAEDLQCDNFIKVIGRNRNICNLPGDFRAVADGDSHISRGKSRGSGPDEGRRPAFWRTWAHSSGG